MLTGPELADRLERVRGRWPDSPFYFEPDNNAACCLGQVACDALGTEPQEYFTPAAILDWIRDNVPNKLRRSTECACYTGEDNQPNWDAAIRTAREWKGENA